MPWVKATVVRNVLYSCRRTSVKKGEDEVLETSPRSSIPLTGDPKADADILAFYKARQKLIREFK